MDNRRIGIFDSGVGGLTVAAEVLKQLPNEEIIYFGDTARVPYGVKTKEMLLKCSTQIIDFLRRQDVKAIIIACGTISSNCYDILKGMYDIPLFDMVTPGVEACLRATRNNTVGVIATERAVSSGTYERCMKGLNPEIKVYQKACPLFVSLAEEGWLDNEVAEMTAGIYLKELVDKGIDTLLLACTHYPLLTGCIRKAAGQATILDPAIKVTEKLNTLLKEKDALRGENTAPSHSFFVSDKTSSFGKISKIALNAEFEAELLDLEKAPAIV